MVRKRVLISLTGSAEGEEPVRMMTTGYLAGSDGNWKLIYKHPSEDGRQEDMTNLTFSGETVSMTRTGENTLSMVFRKGTRYEGMITTPYGSIDMAVFPSVVRYTANEHSGELHLRYQLDLQGKFASEHTMNLIYSESKGRDLH